MSMLRKIEKELDEQKLTILHSAEKVTEQVTQNINIILENKFHELNVKYDNLKEKLENQEKRLYFLEKQSRQRNIIIFGLEETERSYKDLVNIVINFIHRYFQIDLQQRDIQETRRIGKKGEKHRPISITFTTLGVKIEIFKNRRILNDTTYYIKEDFPPHILEKRKELQEIAKIEIEKGNLATIRYDKLIIRSKNNDLPSGKKRALPISPESIAPTQTKQQNIQGNKKNKTQTGPRRSSSLSEGILKPGILNYLTSKKTDGTSKEPLDKNNQ